MSQLSINYVIALPTTDSDRFSPMQGFSAELLERSWIFRGIPATLPPSVSELYLPSFENLQFRLAGLWPYFISPLDVTEFELLPVGPLMPFVVVFTDNHTEQRITAWSRQLEHPVLVVKCDDESGEHVFPFLTRQQLSNHCENVMAYIKSKEPESWIGNLRDRLPALPDQMKFEIEFPEFSHNTTVSNEISLKSVGGYFSNQLPLIGIDEEYIQAIVQSADAVAILRSRIPSGPVYRTSPPLWSMVLTTSGTYLHFQKDRPPKGATADNASRIKRIIQKQQTYAMVSDTEDPAELNRLLNTREAKAFTAARALELTTYTSAIAVWSSSYLAPVLRLPPSVNHVTPEAIKLADAIRASAVRGQDVSLHKLRPLAEKVFQELKSRVDPRFLERIDQPAKHVKIVSDAPIEWLPLRGLPLMLRHTSSRVPTTPGNLSFLETLPRRQVSLSMRDFQETLIIRSFQSEDRLKFQLETYIDHYKLPDGGRIPVRIVDVQNENDLIDALNSFNGALAIFDCHGRHRKGDEAGVLQLEGENVQPWSLRRKAKIPPIVFTCACDTHAMTRNHATCGNGLLFSGATAVIASVLPVDAHKAAHFAARFLYRIYGALPVITGAPSFGFIRWSEVVGMLQQMMFLHELMVVLRQTFPRCEQLGKELELEGVLTIHRVEWDWYESVVAMIAARCGLTVEQIEETRLQKLPFPETLKYLHLGSPESIIVGPEKYDISDLWNEAENELSAPSESSNMKPESAKDRS